MTTYLLTYDESHGLEVHETKEGEEVSSKSLKGTVSIPDLLKGLGGASADQDKIKQKVINKQKVIKTQQQINYLDCIKDGTNVATLQQLEIFPDANEGPSGYPSYPNSLHKVEKDIIDAHSEQIETAYWHKTKPNDSDSELNKSKIYDEVLWESGLGPKWFVKTGVGGVPTSIKTFGSFIDPLEKNKADITWPSMGNTVKIDEKAMKAMGFPNCKLEATTGTGDRFKFEMKIGTGKDCKKSCIITQATADYKKYFAGNKTKNAALKNASSTTSEKVKMIMVKEWGDKMQCLIYLLKHRSTPAEVGTVVMTSCDKVVYILCLLLKVPFIYSGHEGTPNAPKYKHHAISHFQLISDRDRVEYLKKKCEIVKKDITNNNNDFVTFLGSITGDTKFRLANTFDVHFIDPNNGFIPGCIADINAYTQDAVFRLNIEKKNLDDSTHSQEGIERSIATIKEQNTVVPFMKVKKGTDAHLTCNMTCSYNINATGKEKPELMNAFIKYYGLKDMVQEDFNRIPFFQLIRGKNQNGSPLILTSVKKVSEKVSNSAGGSKNKQNGGNKYEKFEDDTVVNVNGVYFASDTERNLKDAAQLIGYTPDPYDPTTWDQYIVRGIMEVPKEGHESVDPNGELFINSDLLTNENLEANLITGILDYCARVKNDMNLFDTLYTTSIYKGIIAAGAQPVSDGAGNRSIPLFPEYDVDDPKDFDAALNSFFGDDSIIDLPEKAPPIIPVTSDDTDRIRIRINEYKQLWCKPQVIENEIDYALIRSIEQEEGEAAGVANTSGAAQSLIDWRVASEQPLRNEPPPDPRILFYDESLFSWLSSPAQLNHTDADATMTDAQTAHDAHADDDAPMPDADDDDDDAPIPDAAPMPPSPPQESQESQDMDTTAPGTQHSHSSPTAASPHDTPLPVPPRSLGWASSGTPPRHSRGRVVHRRQIPASAPSSPVRRRRSRSREPRDNSSAAQHAQGSRIGGKKTKKNKRRKRKTRYKKNKRNNKKTKRNIKRKKRKTRNKTKIRKKVNNKKTRRQKKRSRKQTRRQRRK